MGEDSSRSKTVFSGEITANSLRALNQGHPTALFLTPRSGATYRIVVANEEGGAISAAPSESVSAKSMPTKSVAAESVSAERVSTKSMPTKSMSTHEKFPFLTSHRCGEAGRCER